MLVGGDLNIDSLKAASAEYAQLLTALSPVKDPAAESQSGAPQPTWPTAAPSERVDYLLHHRPSQWALEGVQRVKIGAEPTGCSDHYGVEATLRCTADAAAA